MFFLFTKANQTVYYDGVDTDLRFTLTWNGSADLDLKVRNPSGTTCSYSTKATSGMTLDVDNTTSYGPENISVIDGINGNYSVSVNNYSNGSGIEATVYIFKNEELIEIKKHRFSYNKENWSVFNVELN